MAVPKIALSAETQQGLASLMHALAHDKKTVLGKLKWVLLNRVGHAVIVDGDSISPKLLRDSLHTAFRPNN